jgi:hypothetical protein
MYRKFQLQEDFFTQTLIMNELVDKVLTSLLESLALNSQLI